jgi:hypothetical protein
VARAGTRLAVLQVSRLFREHILKHGSVYPSTTHRRAQKTPHIVCEGVHQGSLLQFPDSATSVWIDIRLNQVTGTIASVRRNRQLLGDEHDVDINGRRSPSRPRPQRRGPSEPSFIAEESFVRAPLNSRVVSNAGILKSKGKAKEEHLNEMPLEVQEAVILEDILYVLTPISRNLPTNHRESKERTSLIMKITLQKTMIPCRVSVSWSRSG